MCTLVEIYFVILILIFSILTIKKKQISLSEEVKRIFNCSERVLLTSNKINISFIYKKLLLTLRKIICLVKEFFLVNSFIDVFWGIIWQLSQHLPRKTPHIFGIFSWYWQFVTATYLFVAKLNLSETVYEQDRFAVPEGVDCLCHCQFKLIGRWFYSANFTFQYLSVQPKNSVSFFKVILYN